MAAQVGKLPPVRFGVIGINHNHIYGMTDLLLRGRGGVGFLLCS